jgi:hypothetical protein
VSELVLLISNIPLIFPLRPIPELPLDIDLEPVDLDPER